MKTKSTTNLRGAELARAVVNQILAHPENWNQAAWHSSCGTKHCFAGWCQILSGNPANTAKARNDAKEALGLSDADSNWYFRSTATLSELHNLASNFDRAGFNRVGFDRDGFDRAGFNRAGFDRVGFDRDGFDRANFDRVGFNRVGFDRDGFDRAGFNRVGFDRDGFDRAGFNRAGFDRANFNRAGFDRVGFDRDGKPVLKPFKLSKAARAAIAAVEGMA